MYLDSAESWKQNYEKLVKSSDLALDARDPGSASSIYGSDRDRWQKPSEKLFKNFAKEQIEICHFFGKRWERYLDSSQANYTVQNPCQDWAITAHILNADGSGKCSGKRKAHAADE